MSRWWIACAGVSTEHRAHFDADVAFSNGGSLSVRDFRLDVPGAGIDERSLAALFVRHLGLLMVGSVELHGVHIVAEPHKGSRGVDVPLEDRGAHVDLSHPIEHGMVTYPGLPGPEIRDHLSWEDSHGRYAEGTEFQIGRISMVANTGTYLDAPAHRHRGGTDLAGLDLARLANLPGVVIDVTGAAEPGIGALTLAPYDVSGRAVLLRTGWDRHWRTEAYGSANASYLTLSAVEWLDAHNAALVGIDSVNIDSAADPQRPAHTLLLAAGIPVLEHLTGLDRLPAPDSGCTRCPRRCAGWERSRSGPTPSSSDHSNWASGLPTGAHLTPCIERKTFPTIARTCRRRIGSCRWSWA